MVAAEGFLLDRQGALEERIRFGVAALILVQLRQVVERYLQLRMVADEVFLRYRQAELVEVIAAALPEDTRMLVVELADNHARHVWMQQEGAYHLGLAVGGRLRLRREN